MSRKALHELGPKRRRTRLNVLLQGPNGRNDREEIHMLPPELNHDYNVRRFLELIIPFASNIH